jgi:hypothetical protein
MAALKDARVSRGGVTSRYRSLETKSVNLDAGKGLEINFKIASKGGGYTAIRIVVGSNDFSTILQMMSKANRQAAMEAMSRELQRQIAEQPKIDIRARDEGRSSLLGLAREKYRQGEAERSLLVGIERLLIN